MQRRDKDWIIAVALVLSGPAWACSIDVIEADEPEQRATESICPPGSELSYDNFGQQFMANYCTGCHARELTEAARSGAPKGYDFDTLEGILEEAEEIDEWAAAGPAAINTAMPPGNGGPTEEERRQLGEWLACEKIAN